MPTASPSDHIRPGTTGSPRHGCSRGFFFRLRGGLLFQQGDDLVLGLVQLLLQTPVFFLQDQQALDEFLVCRLLPAGGQFLPGHARDVFQERCPTAVTIPDHLFCSLNDPGWRHGLIRRGS